MGLSSESYMIAPIMRNTRIHVLTTHYIPRSTLIGHKRKQNNLKSVEDTDLAPILYGRLCTGLEQPNPRTVKILLDSGASASIIKAQYVQKLCLKKNKNPLQWKLCSRRIKYSLSSRHQVFFTRDT